MAEENSTSSFVEGNEQSNLFSVIDRHNVHGLNLTVPEHARELIKPWNEREDTTHFAESGVDDQMIIHIPFSQAVRLKSILLKTARGESEPRRLRIYANHPTIVDFSDAEDRKPHLNISLLEGATGVTEYPLRVAAFTSVVSVSIFLSDSSGGDVSKVYYIGFKGDVRAPRKDPNTHLEIPAADAADAPIIDRLAEKTGGQQTTAR